MVGIPTLISCPPGYVTINLYCTTKVCTPGKNNWRRKVVVDLSGEVCEDNNYYKCDCPPFA